VVVVANPIAGRGAGGSVGAAVRSALERSGREVVTIGTEGGASMGDAIRRAAPARALVVCGGDGTVHSVIGPAHETGMPIYHVPMGTENLFAREFGMTRDPGAVVAALDSGRTDRVDLGQWNGELFALMCSVGPDAGVIHRLDAARTGPIKHGSYLRHILAELAHPRVSTVRIEVDGREVVREGTGMVVVANSRQYAMRIDPACGADMRDGELDVVFLPARSRVRMVSWQVLARARALGIGGGAVRVRGKRMVIHRMDGPFVLQVDGEARGNGSERAVEIEVVPGGLGVVVGKNG